MKVGVACVDVAIISYNMHCLPVMLTSDSH